MVELLPEERERPIHLFNQAGGFAQAYSSTLDAKTTTGPNPGSALGNSHQDSFVGAGPEPISVAGFDREAINHDRGESRAGGMMAGVGSGGISVSSSIRDE